MKYIAFTEDQAKEIRSLGISVVEFKRCIRDGIPVHRYVIDKNIEKIKEAAFAAGQVIRKSIELLNEVIDDVKLIFETVKEAYGYKTSRRYKFVKFVSKLGYDKRDIWVATRHTWLARSNC